MRVEVDGGYTLDWVIVFVEGVRDSGGGTISVSPGAGLWFARSPSIPGVPPSALCTGLSLGRLDKADGVLEAVESQNQRRTRC